MLLGAVVVLVVMCLFCVDIVVIALCYVVGCELIVVLCCGV